MAEPMTPAPQNQSIATGGVPAPDWGDQQAPDPESLAAREAEAAALRVRLARVDVQKYGLDNKARPSVPEDAHRFMPPEPKAELAPKPEPVKAVKKASPAKD